MNEKQFKYVMLGSEELKRALYQCAIDCGWQPWFDMPEKNFTQPVLFVHEKRGQVGLADEGSSVHKDEGDRVTMDEFLVLIENGPLAKPYSIQLKFFSKPDAQGLTVELTNEGWLHLRRPFSPFQHSLTPEETKQLFEAYKKVTKQ